ncbi:MAG: PilZ domain-containing protein [Spirochaetales bacterium]|nr:PilZ domain-containing protein [Spirochaetales bacterium]
MPELRTESRSPGYAKVLVGEIPGQLRDLTPQGCKIVTLSPISPSIGTPIELLIIPDPTSQIPSFTAQGELRWIRNDEIHHNYGFQLTGFSSPKEKEHYHRLVAQYSRS